MRPIFTFAILLTLAVLVSGCASQSREIKEDATIESLTNAIATKVVINEEIYGTINLNADMDDTAISSLVYNEYIVEKATVSWEEFSLQVTIVEIESKDTLNEKWDEYISRLEEHLRNTTGSKTIFTKSTQNFYGSDVTKFTGIFDLRILNWRILKHVWRDEKFIFIIDDIVDVTEEESSQSEIVYGITWAYKFGE